MSKIAKALIGAVVVAVTATGVIAATTFDVSAQKPHWTAISWVLETVRDRSIKAHAANIVVPAGLDDHARIAEGFVHYRAHCAVCHGGPGVEPDDIARGMYPNPPDLRQTAGHRSPAELFWVVKNGIKMSGMPAWGDHGDAELWPVVAFVQQLPSLSAADYLALGSEVDHAQAMEVSPPMAIPVTEATVPMHQHDGHTHHHHH